jgi:hypothetical protein
MTQIARTAAAILLLAALAGCSDNTKKTFGLEANPPDEFAVGTQAPLSLPPELGTLPPPNPGEPRPQQVDAATQGANVIASANAITPAPAAQTPGEQALLGAAGPAPPAYIRAQVNQNALEASKSPSFVQKLLNQAPAAPPAPTVDPAAEAARLQQDAALGIPASNDPTPENAPVQKGILQTIESWF